MASVFIVSDGQTQELIAVVSRLVSTSAVVPTPCDGISGGQLAGQNLRRRPKQRREGKE